MSITNAVTSLSIRAKIAIAFALVLALVGGLGGLALKRAAATNDVVQDMNSNYVLSLVDLGDMRGAFANYRFDIGEAVAEAGDKAAEQKLESGFDETYKVYRENDAKYASTVDSDEEKSIYDKIKAGADAFFAYAHTLRGLIGDGKAEEAKTLYFSKAAPLSDEVDRAIEEDLHLNAHGAGVRADSATQSYISGSHELYRDHGTRGRGCFG